MRGSAAARLGGSWPTWLAIVLVMIVASLPLPSRAGGTSDSPTVSAPSSLSIETGTSEVVQISGRNMGAGDGVALVVEPSAGITTSAPQQSGGADGPVWVFRLKVDSALAGDTGLAMRVVRTRDHATIAAATIKVTPRPAATVDATLGAELVPDGDSMFAGQPATVQLKLTNKSDSSLQVTRLHAYQGSIFVTRIGDRRAASWTIAPRGTLLQPLTIDVNLDQPLISGSHKLGLVVSVKRLSHDRPWTGDVPVNKDITIGLPGMSVLKDALQVPTFLVLPGFLILITFALVQARAKAGDGERAAALSIAMSPTLWVIAITISGIVIALYPALSALFLGTRRSILYGYDLTDVSFVWIGSIIVGALAGLAVRGAAALFAWYHAQRIFVAGEDPIPFLERLQRMGIPQLFPYVSVADNGTQYRLYQLNRDQNAAQLWGAPMMVYDIVAGHEAEVDGVALSDLACGRLEALLTRLKALAEAGHIQVRWKNFTGIDGPTQIARASFDRINVSRIRPIFDEG